MQGLPRVGSRAYRCAWSLANRRWRSRNGDRTLRRAATVMRPPVCEHIKHYIIRRGPKGVVRLWLVPNVQDFTRIDRKGPTDDEPNLAPRVSQDARPRRGPVAAGRPQRASPAR